MSEFINLLILPFQEMKGKYKFVTPCVLGEYSVHVVSPPLDKFPVLSSSNLELHLVSMVNPSCVIPLKKQQGFLNLFGQMISVVGSKVKNYLRVLFPILLNMGAACASLLEQRNEVRGRWFILRFTSVLPISSLYPLFLSPDSTPLCHGSESSEATRCQSSVRGTLLYLLCVCYCILIYVRICRNTKVTCIHRTV